MANQLEELLWAEWQAKGVEQAKARENLRLLVDSLDSNAFRRQVRGVRDRWLLKRLLQVGLTWAQQAEVYSRVGGL